MNKLGQDTTILSKRSTDKYFAFNKLTLLLVRIFLNELISKGQNWPFEITHKFTHTLGVCNARNLALKELRNDWVFFADDDIRFHSTLFEESFETLNNYGTKALNYSCLLENQKQTYFSIGQTFIFGSGSSFVSSEIAKQLN